MKPIQYKKIVWSGPQATQEEREISGEELYAAMPYATPENMAEMISRWSNSAFRDVEIDASEFVREVTSSHRTLQQGVIRFLFRALTKYGRVSQETGYDDRNKAAILLCRKLALLVATDKLSEYMSFI